jgi:riboflavin synthase
MFTGIIEEIGKVEQTSYSGGNLLLKIKAPRVLEGLKLGDSININGACQTVIESGKGFFVVEAVAETLKRTNLDQLKVGDSVNLERALGASDRLGGHLVTGHIDFLGKIRSISPKGESQIFEFSYPVEYKSHFVDKGSVAVDGVSLTIVDVLDDSFTVSVIPFTVKSTTLGSKKTGDSVNIETDLIGKYIRRMLTVEKDQSKITEKWLKEKGF